MGHSFNAFAGLGNPDLEGTEGVGNINHLANEAGLPINCSSMGFPDPTNLLSLNLFWIPAGWDPDVDSADMDNPPWYQGEEPLGYDLPNNLWIDSRGFRIDTLRQSDRLLLNENTADAFLNWVQDLTTGNWQYGQHGPDQSYKVFPRGFTHEKAGNQWRNFMNTNMGAWIRNAVVYNISNVGLLSYLQSNHIVPQFEMQVSVSNPAFGMRLSPEQGIRQGNIEDAQNSDGDVIVVGRYEDWIAVKHDKNVLWTRQDAFDWPENINYQDLPIINYVPSMSIEETPWWRGLLDRNPDGGEKTNL